MAVKTAVKKALAKAKGKKPLTRKAGTKKTGQGLTGLAAALGTVLGRTEHKVRALVADLKSMRGAAKTRRAAAGSGVKQAAEAVGRSLGRAERELAKAQAEFKRALSEARK